MLYEEYYFMNKNTIGVLSVDLDSETHNLSVISGQFDACIQTAKRVKIYFT